jgi:hypothetical protein
MHWRPGWLSRISRIGFTTVIESTSWGGITIQGPSYLIVSGFIVEGDIAKEHKDLREVLWTWGPGSFLKIEGRSGFKY